MGPGRLVADALLMMVSPEACFAWFTLQTRRVVLAGAQDDFPAQPEGVCRPPSAFSRKMPVDSMTTSARFTTSKFSRDSLMAVRRIFLPLTR